MTQTALEPEVPSAAPQSRLRASIHQIAPTALVLLAALLPLLLAPLRARYLGPHGRGEFAFFQASVMIVTAAAGGGIRHAYYGQEHTGGARRGLWTSKIWLPAIGLAALAGAPLAVAGYTSLGPVVAIGIGLVVLGAPLYALVQLEMADAQFHQRQLRVGALASVPAFFEFIANICLLTARAVTVTSAIAITISSEVLRSVAAWIFRHHDRPAGPRIRDVEASRLLARRAFAYLPATLVPLVAANVDSIVFGALGHSSALGVYSVAKLAPSFLLLAAGVSEGRFLAVVGRLGAKRGILLSAIPLLGMAFLAAVGGGLVVEPLFGAAFAGARPAFVVTSVLGAVGAMYIWLVALCAQRGLSGVSIRSSLVVLIVGFVGSVVIGLAPHPSPVVIGFPVLLGYLLGSALVAYTLRRVARAA